MRVPAPLPAPFAAARHTQRDGAPMRRDPVLSVWLDSQERMMRTWLAEAMRDPGVDSDWLERLEAHHRWLQNERDAWIGAPPQARF